MSTRRLGVIGGEDFPQLELHLLHILIHCFPRDVECIHSR